MTLKMIVQIMIALLLVTLTGCATPALMEIGQYKEEAAKYNKAIFTNDSVVIAYDAKVASRSKEVRQEKRWIKIPMDLIIHPDKERGSVYWLSNLKDHEGELPNEFKSSVNLPIVRLASWQELASQRPATEHKVIVYSNLGKDSEDFYFLGIDGNGKQLYSHFYTSREGRNPWAYLVIVPALPFTIVYDSIAFLVVSVTGIDTR